MVFLLFTMKRFIVALLFLLLGLDPCVAKEKKVQRELIDDPQFQHGFTLADPKPGKHVRTGELKGFDAKAKPAWALLEWSSRFPLTQTNLIEPRKGVLVYSNAAKAIVLGAGKAREPDLTMIANSALEYGPTAKKAGEPWIHLLVEQHFPAPAPLAGLSTATLHVEARLLHARNLHQDDYTPDVHAAQFQIFFTVQNRNKESKGFGDLVWFGVPIYDNRDRFAKEIKMQDFGGTAKFIFTPEGRTFSAASAHDGDWIVIDKDLLPLMREALQTAWARGFLQDSKEIADYYIGGMNMGWELPGSFDVSMQVRGLSLKLTEK